jgi:hypothetical protein
MSKESNLNSEEKVKAAVIMHAVEVKSSFELYAYRIISHEQFQQRIIELSELVLLEIKNAKRDNLTTVE